MGMLELKPQEAVLFPTPYVEDEVAPIVVTNQRVVAMAKDQRRELDAKKITFVGRQTSRPLLFIGLFFALTALPLVGWAGWQWLQVKGMPSFEEQPPAEEHPDYEDPGAVRLRALLEGVGGAVALIVGAFLVTRKRHVVVCRADKRVLKLRVPDKTVQMQVMMTVQAALQTAKQMPVPQTVPLPTQPPPAAPPKK